MKSHIVLLVTVFRFADLGFITGKITEAEIEGNSAIIQPEPGGVKHKLHHNEWRLATEEEIMSLTPDAPDSPAPGEDPPVEFAGTWDEIAEVYIGPDGHVVQPETDTERVRRGLAPLPGGATAEQPVVEQPVVEQPVVEQPVVEPDPEPANDDAPDNGPPDASGLPDEQPPAEETAQTGSEGEQNKEDDGGF